MSFWAERVIASLIDAYFKKNPRLEEPAAG
jgi:hypothetical protein